MPSAQSTARPATLALLVIGLATALPSRASAADYDPDKGKSEIATLEATWHDRDRDRDVPVKIYYPKSPAGNSPAGRSPVIIFSHGLGGSREGYSYLGQCWAAHGYVSVHLTHKGSDTEAITQNPQANRKQLEQEIAANPENALNRFKDVSFAIDQLNHLNKDLESPLHGSLDLEHIGMAGHSYGAGTTMVVSGELTHNGRSFADDRISCAIAMSPPQTMPSAKLDQAFADFKIPLFVMTGTKDDSPVGETKAAERRAGFDHVKDTPAFLLTFDGGDHMLFSGRPRQNKSPTDDRYHQLILQGSLAFWDAFLRRNADAKKWLEAGSFEKAVADAGKFEQRNAGHQ